MQELNQLVGRLVARVRLGRRLQSAERPLLHGHQPGKLFVLLDPDDVEALLLPLGELGLARSWRAVGFGSLFEDAETVVHAHGGRDLLTLAPVHVTGSRNGTSGLTLSWQRRTRIGGERRDDTGTVPLCEASEVYEVDILDGPDGAVLRTISGLSNPTAVYGAAEQTADFGTPQDIIHLRAFQLSAITQPDVWKFACGPIKHPGCSS